MWPMKILCPIPVQKQPHLYFRVISLAGLDYVAHEDTVPYTSTETATPINQTMWPMRIMCPIPVQKQPHLYFRVISLAGIDYVAYEDIVPYTNTETVYNRVISLAGLDYVAHEDIVPYTSTETATPIQQSYFPCRSRLCGP